LIPVEILSEVEALSSSVGLSDDGTIAVIGSNSDLKLEIVNVTDY